MARAGQRPRPIISCRRALRREYVGKGQLWWVTTDYVLDETITRLFAGTPFVKAQELRNAIFDSSKIGLLVVEPITPERFQRAYKTRLRYRGKPRVSFTDLTSFTVMRELGIRQVLSADAHFQQAGLGFHRLL